MTTRFGIIGFGAWGRCYANAMKNIHEVSLNAIATGNERDLETVRKENPGVTVVSDHRKLLDKRELDAIVLVTPNHLHHSIGLDVLQADKHLLVEKPFALNGAECDELIRVAAAKKLHLAVGHQFRLSSLWGEIKNLIDAGFVGVPKYVLIELSRNPYRQGEDGWRYDAPRVGNWILEEPVHFLDLACWYLESCGKPVSIYASANSSRDVAPELYDNLSAILNFQNGSHAVVAQTLSAFEHHQTVKITGTKGSLWGGWSGVMDRTLHPTFFLKTFDGEMVRDVPIEKMTGELYELEDQIRLMANVLQGRANVHCTGEEGRHAVMLSLAAQKSATEGKPVTLTDRGDFS